MKVSEENSCRLDKWLWAARFFKTRSLAADAVDSGKVRVNGTRAKNAKEVKIGMLIAIKTKDFEIEIAVMQLSNVRRGSPEAMLLYEETPDSKHKREQNTAKDLNFAHREKGAGRPTKKELRVIKKFTDVKDFF